MFRRCIVASIAVLTVIGGSALLSAPTSGAAATGNAVQNMLVPDAASPCSLIGYVSTTVPEYHCTTNVEYGFTFRTCHALIQFGQFGTDAYAKIQLTSGPCNTGFGPVVTNPHPVPLGNSDLAGAQVVYGTQAALGGAAFATSFHTWYQSAAVGGIVAGWFNACQENNIGHPSTGVSCGQAEVTWFN